MFLRCPTTAQIELSPSLETSWVWPGVGFLFLGRHAKKSPSVATVCGQQGAKVLVVNTTAGSMKN